MRSIVTVRGDQVEPQAATKPFRPAGSPLRGATITGFTSPNKNHYRLEYIVNGAKAQVDYRLNDTTAIFTFTDATGTSRSVTYVH